MIDLTGSLFYTVQEDSYEFESGTSRPVCLYKIFAKKYSRAVVLVRPRDNWSCSDFGDPSAVTVNLKDAMRIPRERMVHSRRP